MPWPRRETEPSSWFGNIHPSNSAADIELWAAGKTTWSSRRSHSARSPLQASVKAGVSGRAAGLRMKKTAAAIRPSARRPTRAWRTQVRAPSQPLVFLSGRGERLLGVLGGLLEAGRHEHEELAQPLEGEERAGDHHQAVERRGRAERGEEADRREEGGPEDLALPGPGRLPQPLPDAPADLLDLDVARERGRGRGEDDAHAGEDERPEPEACPRRRPRPRPPPAAAPRSASRG